MDVIICMLTPVLAGIRADKPARPTFPYKKHSGLRDALSVELMLRTDACFTVAGAAHVCHLMIQASCFPFNCGHGHVRGHQNCAIVRLGPFMGKFTAI
jgi:hypothetical protein